MHDLETKEESAELLQDLFQYANVSYKDVAKLLNVNDRTVKNWLDAYSAPDFPTVRKMFRLLHVPMQPFLHDRGRFLEAETDKDAIIYYVNNVASSEELRDMRFNLTFKHGSSVGCQLAMMSMLNHMKLRYRLIAAKVVLNLWDLAKTEGGLQYADDTTPNVDKVLDATVKTHKALREGKQSYTDI